MLDITEGIDGNDTLARLLGQRPNPKQPSSINRFISDLPEADAKTLYKALEEPAPENAIDYASRALNRLSRKSLVKRREEISSQLKQANLSAEEIQNLLSEASEIGKLLNDSNNS